MQIAACLKIISSLLGTLLVVQSMFYLTHRNNKLELFKSGHD